MELSKKKGGGSTQVQPCLTILGPNSLWAIWWIWCSSPLWQSWWPNKHQVHLQPNNRNPVLWFCVWGHECRHHCESRNRSPVLGNIQVIVVSLNQKSNTCFPKEGMNISIKVLVLFILEAIYIKLIYRSNVCLDSSSHPTHYQPSNI